jgi:hypothetical protein
MLPVRALLATIKVVPLGLDRGTIIFLFELPPMAAQRERSPPPDYAAPSGAVEQRFHSNGFPSGYFIIRSIATGRLLDVSGSSNQDGSEVVLWPEKDGSLVHG